MEVSRRMRWRQDFMAEVTQMLHQLGMLGCPVCGSAEPPGISPFPVVLIEAGFGSGADDEPPGGQGRGDMTFAIQVECATCGHLMLFNAQKYRAGDEKILQREPAEEQGRQFGE